MMLRVVLVPAMLIALTGAAQAQLRSAEQPDANIVWKKVRAGLFNGQPITPVGDDMLLLDAPVRADDAAIVPIAIKTRFAQSPTRYVDKLYLIIDSNPSPISAIFQFTPQSGRADIETRVRIDDFSHVRAVAQMNDGQLYMTTRYVKAAGGCSAPPPKDMQAAQAAIGKIKFRIESVPGADGGPVLAQLMVSHPNSSGFAIDPASNKPVPAHFVRKIDVSYRGQPLMSADLDFSISENPSLRFWFLPQGEGELKAEVIDSNDLKFESIAKVN